MRILVACEFSGVVRDAFRKQGHEAWSCDLLPSEGEFPNYHLEGDVRGWLYGPGALPWDLMIAHPPCTYLANSGERWLKGNPERKWQRSLALAFVGELWRAPIERVAIENPVGHLSTAWRKPDQIIQPFHHGHPEWKTTCLWLRGLPPLEPTRIVEPDERVGGGKKPGRISSRIHRLTPSPDRARERSRTFSGIAAAFVEQWGH